MIYYTYKLLKTMEFINDTFSNEDQFSWFIKRVNKYNVRYDYLPDGATQEQIDVDDDGEMYIVFKDRLYKIYDKYTPTIIARKLSGDELRILLRALNDEDIIYQQLIYDYCTTRI